jgi:hypothetical protein
VIYDFTCTQGHTVERRASITTVSVDCPECGGVANRSQVNRVAAMVVGPRGERVQTYYEAAQEARFVHDSTDDPTVKAATRPDIWRPALQRAKTKHFGAALGVEESRWADPNPGLSERERLREQL